MTDILGLDGWHVISKPLFRGFFSPLPYPNQHIRGGPLVYDSHTTVWSPPLLQPSAPLARGFFLPHPPPSASSPQFSFSLLPAPAKSSTLPYITASSVPTSTPTTMPRTLDPSKYPDEFHTLMNSALSTPILIPAESPAGLRGYIQSFLRAVEAAGGLQAERAKQLQVTSSKEGVTIQRRSEGSYARQVRAALGGLDTKAEASSSELELLRRLTSEPQP